MVPAGPCKGQSWDQIELILGNFGLCWDILGHVGTILGSDWAILGYFGVCVGLCLGLGHFIVIEFSSVQTIFQKRLQIPGKIPCLGSLLDGLCCFCFFLLGYAEVRLCLPDLGLTLYSNMMKSIWQNILAELR